MISSLVELRKVSLHCTLPVRKASWTSWSYLSILGLTLECQTRYMYIYVYEGGNCSYGKLASKTLTGQVYIVMSINWFKSIKVSPPAGKFPSGLINHNSLGLADLYGFLRMWLGVTLPLYTYNLRNVESKVCCHVNTCTPLFTLRVHVRTHVLQYRNALIGLTTHSQD